MSGQHEPTTRDASRTAMTTGNPGDGGIAKVIYILYLVAMVVALTAVVGVIIAYVNKDEAPEWVRSHYRFQIRTFWIGLLYSFIGTITTPIIVGWFVLLLVLVWLVIRCAKGLMWVEKGQPVRNVETWMLP